MKDNSGKIILALLAGASAGVIAGLLMAPDSGTATRDSLKKSASKLGKDLEKKLQEGMAKMESMNAGGLIDQATSMLGMNKGGDSQTGSNTGSANAGSNTGRSAASGSTGSSASSGSAGSTAGNTGSSAGGGSTISNS
ncbi:YtxH domain-containing protein [Adhaeribacter sp. BT258]|uniref:YtxH domain-containing protein n=1 Tax=Adhaeribacter terrigena TaxID=2793070 RepID=A0ABS1BX95_9BACT|nr:YtxH domain-containing protein [Adhaeribacter terrigena]MBK0401772.1 YtxH domain-containing protein [Adhaeribacter terrigena]